MTTHIFIVIYKCITRFDPTPVGKAISCFVLLLIKPFYNQFYLIIYLKSLLQFQQPYVDGNVSVTLSHRFRTRHTGLPNYILW